MRFHSMLMLAGLAIAGVGGVAAADPDCHHDGARYDDDYDRRVDEGRYVPTNGYGTNGSYATVTYSTPGYATPGTTSGGYVTEPAPGTYVNGYIWVAGRYDWAGGQWVWSPAHWQLGDPGYVDARTASSYRRPVHWHHHRGPTFSVRARF